MISYTHWRDIDPSCSVLARNFNICIKLSKIPSSWKSSKTVLIQGDDIGNSIPAICASSTLLQALLCDGKKFDWCETLEVLAHKRAHLMMVLGDNFAHNTWPGRRRWQQI
ncbi:hypothetical protein TNCT_690981 [Trichonephila clavata]|uniref:Uncharacterized protein n=1 Tax=Trichonephila clavata TaxID=2740835 RepID=A0A8X6H284_TRICU|nr:hypothetical protein TNCT_690981 [Trichonephila clavata]